ncbi:hypothetical protein TGAM01_v202133 [Trichoderma gamsii]|uniref:Uncharacterized protein n=1 Tax=Trichoderma gamsii TaxID=398673 RepID=A0A2P4ZXJ6_9HYPO|nr:hypothetical protein TGAM01_v202133 [Trichoderma gamsii]PON29025.1 hypothetical protein TGAM01_v202133 [Trichoderma gamsii]
MDEVKRDLSDYSRSILLATRLVSTSLYIFIACFSIKRLCDVLSIFDGFIILMCLTALVYGSLDVIFPSLFDSTLSSYTNTRLRCDVILCLGFTIASTTLSRAASNETLHESLYWERDMALSEMRRIQSTLSAVVSTFHMGMCIWQPL